MNFSDCVQIKINKLSIFKIVPYRNVKVYDFISKTNMYECLKNSSSKIMIRIDQSKICPVVIRFVHSQVPKYIRPNYFLLHTGLKSLSGREFRYIHVFPCRILAGTPRTNAPEIRVVVARFSNTRDRASCQTNSTAIIFA